MDNLWNTASTAFPIVKSHFFLRSSAMSLGSFDIEGKTSLADWCFLPPSAILTCQCFRTIYSSAEKPTTSQCFWTLLKVDWREGQFNETFCKARTSPQYALDQSFLILLVLPGGLKHWAHYKPLLLVRGCYLFCSTHILCLLLTRVSLWVL